MINGLDGWTILMFLHIGHMLQVLKLLQENIPGNVIKLPGVGMFRIHCLVPTEINVDRCLISVVYCGELESGRTGHVRGLINVEPMNIGG